MALVARPTANLELFVDPTEFEIFEFDAEVLLCWVRHNAAIIG